MICIAHKLSIFGNATNLAHSYPSAPIWSSKTSKFFSKAGGQDPEQKQKPGHEAICWMPAQIHYLCERTAACTVWIVVKWLLQPLSPLSLSPCCTLGLTSWPEQSKWGKIMLLKRRRCLKRLNKYVRTYVRELPTVGHFHAWAINEPYLPEKQQALWHTTSVKTVARHFIWLSYPKAY